MTAIAEQPAPAIGRRSAKALAERVQVSERKLKPFREHRLRFIRAGHGPYYGRVGGSNDPLPTVALYVQNMLANLLYARVRAAISSPIEDNGFQALASEQAFAVFAEMMNLSTSLRRVITDSLYGMGIMRVGRIGPPEIDPDAAAQQGMSLMVPYADPVDLDNYCVDPDARCREEALFEGDAFRIPKQYAMECGIYDPDKIARLSTIDSRFGQERADKTSNEGVGWGVGEDWIELRYIWLRNENVVVTIPGQQESVDDYLAQFPWDGGERGPYETLAYEWVPDNLMPVPPIARFYDLHRAINRAAAKQMRQADRGKDLLLFDQTTPEGEAETVRTAGDGEMLGVQNVDRYKQVSLGHANPKGYENLAFLMDQYQRFARNPDLTGGFKAGSDTLGQDQMLMQAAKIGIGSMRQAVSEFASHVGRKLFRYMMQDQSLEMPMVVNAKGIDVPYVFAPAKHPSRFEDYQFNIDLYSEAPQTAEGRYRALHEWYQLDVLPSLPAMAMMGVQVDIGSILTMMAKFHGLPMAGSLVQPMPQQPMLPQPPGAASQPSQKPQPANGRGRAFAKPEPVGQEIEA